MFNVVSISPKLYKYNNYKCKYCNGKYKITINYNIVCKCFYQVRNSWLDKSKVWGEYV